MRTSPQIRHESAALRDFNPAYDCSGSFSSDRHAPHALGMSVAPIATELVRRNQLTRSAKSGHSHRSNPFRVKSQDMSRHFELTARGPLRNKAARRQASSVHAVDDRAVNHEADWLRLATGDALNDAAFTGVLDRDRVRHLGAVALLDRIVSPLDRKTRHIGL
jgi:hypothetical protein